MGVLSGTGLSATRTMQVTVVGAGSWGTTVAVLTARNAPTLLWCRGADLAEQINKEHRNETYLGAQDLPADLRATPNLAEAAAQADVLIMAVPSHGFRSVLEELAP